MKSTSLLRLIGICALVLTAAAVAGSGGKGPKGPPAAAKGSASHGSVERDGGPKVAAPKAGSAVNVHVAIRTDEARLIQAYVDDCRKPGRGGGLPPGLAKKVARGGDLPPGWHQKCIPGWIIPIDIFHHCHPLPHALVVKLPAPPPGTMLVAIDGRVVRVHKETREVHAVFDVRL